MNYLLATDEVGYGSLIGNLLVGGIRAETNWSIDGLNDSKKLSPKRRQQLREELLKEVKKGNITYYIATRTHTQIDEFGVYNVLKDAHIEAIKALYQPSDYIIVDGDLKFDGLGVDDLPIQSMIKADTKISQCMAASIIAKTTRDEQMRELSKQFPQYGWGSNMGYWRKDHIAAIEKYGITEYHRKSYDPVKSMVKNEKANK